MSKPAPIEGLDSTTSLDEAARRSIATRLADVRKFEEKLTGALDADDVHDMRVASRRLRAALQLFERKKQLRDAHDATKAHGDALGEVRELHVQLQWLDDALTKADGKDKPGLQSLRDERHGKLQRRVDKLRTALGTWQSDGVPTIEAALGAFAAGGRLGGRRVRDRIARQLKGAKKRVVAAAKSDDPRTAHKLRIAAKKLRYTAELAQPAFAKEMDALIDRLQPLQETLGQLHDADVHVAVVEKFLVRADAATQAGALTLLRDEMTRREQQAAGLADALGALRQERFLEELRDALC
jgi:CHAD domain-containing protein